jgi:Spy/CpxP family protein refolding chaperone
MGMRALAQLDLTPEQRDRITELHERQARKAIQARADLETARLDMRKLMRADTPDRRALDTQIDRIAGLEAGLRKDRVATLLDVRALLTPDQRKKLETMRDGAWGRGPGWGGGWDEPDADDEEDDGL